MTILISEVPQSTLSRQVGRLLFTSLGLAFLILIPSLAPFLGSSSVFVTPITCGMTMVHNITLLILLRKHRNRHSGNPDPALLPPTATKASIICTWLLIPSFASGFGISLALLIIPITYGEFQAAHGAIIPELLLVAVEIGVLGTFAVKSTRERRQILGGAETKRWYQLRDQK